MDIMELGAIGELVGGVVVFASLVFVGMQIRQNTRAIRTAAVHDSNLPFAQLNSDIVSNRDLVDLIQRVRTPSSQRLCARG